MQNNNGSRLPLVSVIIPTYNRANIINKSIDSVLNQTYSNLELIIIDDGSHDNTEEVIKNYDDKRLKYYKLEENKGMCFARNYGTNLSKGHYIAIHDSDDLWKIDKLEKHITYMQENKVDMSFSRIRRYYIDGTSEIVPKNPPIIDENILDTLLMGNFIPSITMVLTRDLALNVSFDPIIKRYTDWDYSLRVVKSDYKIGFIDELLAYSYIQKDSSAINQNSHNSIKVMYDRYLDDITKNKKVHSIFLYNLGMTSPNRTAMVQYLVQSMKYDKKVKTLLILMLAKLNLFNFTKKIRQLIKDKFKRK